MAVRDSGARSVGPVGWPGRLAESNICLTP